MRPGAVQLSSKHITLTLRSLYERLSTDAAMIATNRLALRPIEAGRRQDFEDARVSEEEMRKRLDVLRVEHRDLDAAIDALTGAGSTDQLQIARLKKRKLRLKDQMSLLEDYLIPDIIA